MFPKKVVLRILLVILAIAATGSIIAQVSNQINLADVWSPSGLKQKPNNLRVPQNRPTQNIFTNPNDIPDEVVYGQVFEQIDALNQKANQEQQNNRNGTKFRNVFKEMARLNDKQARDLDRISQQTNQRLKLLDNRAKPMPS